MEQFYYTSYLLVVFLSTLLIKFVAKIKIDLKKALVAIIPVLVIFLSWDIIATELGHWDFGFDKMLGVVIINQPIEEIAFFLVIPLFHIIVWETIKKFIKK